MKSPPSIHGPRMSSLKKWLIRVISMRWRRADSSIRFGEGRNRQGDTETSRQGDRETSRQGDRETNRQGDRETNRQGDRETNSQGDRETNRQGDKQTRRQTDKETNGRQKHSGARIRCAAGGWIAFIDGLLRLLHGRQLPCIGPHGTGEGPVFFELNRVGVATADHVSAFLIDGIVE